MPQREFWTSQHPVEVVWRYWVNLKEPQAPSQLTITVYDQSGQMMEHAGEHVPFQVLHEAVSGMLVDSWEGFLFGERHAAPRALKLAGQRWRKFARTMSVYEES